jgi:UDP:flavonoid glycosyltransferase YjiC (YdhE family)
MCQLLFGGVPLVLGPLHPEQLLASQRIVAAGAGLIVNHTDPKQMLAGIYEVTSQTRYRAAAQEFAARYAKFDQAKLDAQMYAEIDRAIGSS